MSQAALEKEWTHEDRNGKGLNVVGRSNGVEIANPADRLEVIHQNDPDTSDILFFGISLAVLQLMDGVLTSIGVSRFGVGIEGNPVLRALMSEFGHIQTLTLLKILAILIVIGLTALAYRLPWIKNAMGALTCLYLVAAVIPWTYLLFIKPFIS